MLKRILSIALLLCLICCAASAEIPLPIDFSGGSPLIQENITEMGYSDSTITVEITKGKQNGTEYWVADIVIQDASQLRTVSAGGFDSSATAEGTRLSARVNAVLAINGDYYSSAEKSGFGYIVRQGITYRNNLETENYYQARLMDVLLIDEDGDFHIIYQPIQGEVPETIDGKRIINAFSFGPGLVDGGVKVPDYHRADRRFIDMAMDQLRQRVALCQAGPLHYKVVVCSGPSMGSKGLTLPEFANLVMKQDVQVAYNMDGGDSSFLILANRRINGKSNRAREILDIIYFASAE